MAKKTLLVAMLIVGFASTAVALPNDPWNPLNPGDEYNVYEVYDFLFGTDHSVGGSSSLPVADPSAIFGDNYAFEAQARYAGAQYTTLGWHPAGDSNPANQNPLFSVNTSGWLGGSPSGNTFSADSDYRFYINLLTPSGVDRTFFTEDFLNAGGANHVMFFSVDGDPDTFLMCWEDNIPGRWDQDYNDLIVVLRRVVIPEPTSMALLGIGLAGMAARRLRRR